MDLDICKGFLPHILIYSILFSLNYRMLTSLIYKIINHKRNTMVKHLSGNIHTLGIKI